MEIINNLHLGNLIIDTQEDTHFKNWQWANGVFSTKNRWILEEAYFQNWLKLVGIH